MAGEIVCKEMKLILNSEFRSPVGLLHASYSVF